MSGMSLRAALLGVVLCCVVLCCRVLCCRVWWGVMDHRVLEQ